MYLCQINSVEKAVKVPESLIQVVAPIPIKQANRNKYGTDWKHFAAKTDIQKKISLEKVAAEKVVIISKTKKQKYS